MATIAGNQELKILGEMQPGELFRALLKDGGAICIRTDINENGIPLICAVKYDAQSRHVFEPKSQDMTGISYGSDWVLEPILGSESFPGGALATDGYGILWMRDIEGRRALRCVYDRSGKWLIHWREEDGEEWCGTYRLLPC